MPEMFIVMFVNGSPVRPTHTHHHTTLIPISGTRREYSALSPLFICVKAGGVTNSNSKWRMTDFGWRRPRAPSSSTGYRWRGAGMGSVKT